MSQNHRNEMKTPSPEKSEEQPHVIGIHGAAEQHTRATHALSEVLRAAEMAGATAELIDLAEVTLPPHNTDWTEPDDALDFISKISQADAFVLATSVRHDSYSALLKTALDYCASEEFNNKPVGLVAVTERSRPALALEHLRTVCTTLNARVLPIQVSINTTLNGDELPEESLSALWKLGQEVVDEQ